MVVLEANTKTLLFLQNQGFSKLFFLQILNPKAKLFLNIASLEAFILIIFILVLLWAPLNTFLRFFKIFKQDATWENKNSLET